MLKLREVLNARPKDRVIAAPGVYDMVSLRMAAAMGFEALYMTGYGTVALRKGAMVKDGAPVLPLGSLLRPGEPLTLQDEEVPREGVRVRRVPTLARRADGTYVRWVTRRVTVGRGEGGSGLAFDSAVRRRPAAP